MASYTLSVFTLLLIISFSSSASKSKSGVNQRNDVQYHTVVPDALPQWLTDVERKFLASSPTELRDNADIVVAKDGKANYKTVQEAVDAAPNHSKSRFIIHVKKGVYNEIVRIGVTKTNLTIVGDGRDVTILTGSLNYHDGVKTYNSATLAMDGAGFMAQYIGIRNTAGPAKGQAVALRVSADRSVLYRCGMEAYQDTLYAFKYRQFYRECYITGTVDFICGKAAAVFQYCHIEARKPQKGQRNVITAQSRQNLTNDNSGFTIQKCNITASPDLAPFKRTVKTYLGRPWSPYSTVAIMQSFIDDHVDPEGWAPWDSDYERQSTVIYREYRNRGAGANTGKRVKWRGVKIVRDPNEAENFTLGKLFLNEDFWLNSTRVPYEKGL